MNCDEVALHFLDNADIRVEIKEDIVVRTKIISIETLLECLKAGLLKSQRVMSGVLPPGTVSCGYSAESRQKYVVLDFSDDKADITYMNTEYKDFPLPRLLFGFVLEQSGRISSVRLGVTVPGKLDENAVMYRYPFSNVNGFYLCTGTNVLPKIHNLKSLAGIPYYLLSLPDNDDYYKESNTRLNMGHRELLEHLRDKDRQYYYDNVLIPIPNKTVKNFIEF